VVSLNRETVVSVAERYTAERVLGLATTAEEQPKISLIAGASWLIVAKTLSFAITIALPFLLVRRLTQTEFGYYKQLFQILQTAMNLLPFGMHMSLFYFLPRAKGRDEKGNIILGVLLFYLFTTGIAGGCLILYPGLLQALFHSQPLTNLGRQIGFTLIPYVITSLFEFILVANSETRLSAILIVVVNVTRTLSIIGAALYWGTIGAILSSLSIFLVFQSVWMSTYLFRRFGKFWKHFRWHLLWTQLSYALPLGLAGLLWGLQMDAHNYFVGHYYNAALYAIYATGCFQLPLVGILADSVGAVLIPRMSSLQSTESTAEIVSLTMKAIRGLAAVYAPLFAFMFVTANQFITVLFTTRYLASVPIFRINLLMVLLAIIAVDPIIRAFKTERFWLLKMNIALLALQVGALFVGITRFGLPGAIASVVIVQYTNRMLVVWRVTRLLGVHWEDIRQLKDVGKTLMAATAAGLCIFALLGPIARWGALPSLVICCVVFGAVYVVALFVLKVPTESEISWLWTRTRNLRSSYLAR
jgi:O-antigen/teichoic acid export membrane protein